MENKTIAVVGLGYVGLPLVVEFGKHCKAIGFDIDVAKVESCRRHRDPSGELTVREMRLANFASFTSSAKDLSDADFIIIAVPTPVDEFCKPDLTPLMNAARVVGSVMKIGATVVFESTVFPGATEEVCIPILEEYSGRTWKKQFFVGYSPERINPGDKSHSLRNVVKVVSGDCYETLIRIKQLYELVVDVGVYAASSIQVAEAAKVIENTQRDLNIALMNELSIIFDRMNIDTSEVLDAAATKWNFLPFKPGLVGGHCIGVDPYYLTYKSQLLGYYPQIILAGRRINDGMGKYIAEQTIKNLIHSDCTLTDTEITILGVTFKENCADIRNSKVPDILKELETYGLSANVADCEACSETCLKDLGITLTDYEHLPVADALIVAVSHKPYESLSETDLKKLLKPGGLVVDVKACLSRDELEALGYKVWRL